GDRAEHGREVPRGALAPLLGTRVLLALERGVGATEVGLPADELRDAGARAVGVVVERVAVAADGVGVGEDRHGVVLRRGTRRGERLVARALDAVDRLGGGVTAARVVVRTGGDCDRREGGEAEESTCALEVHLISLIGIGGVPPSSCVERRT